MQLLKRRDRENYRLWTLYSTLVQSEAFDTMINTTTISGATHVYENVVRGWWKIYFPYRVARDYITVLHMEFILRGKIIKDSIKANNYVFKNKTIYELIKKSESRNLFRMEESEIISLISEYKNFIKGERRCLQKLSKQTYL